MIMVTGAHDTSNAVEMEENARRDPLAWGKLASYDAWARKAAGRVPAAGPNVWLARSTQRGSADQFAHGLSDVARRTRSGKTTHGTGHCDAGRTVGH